MIDHDIASIREEYTRNALSKNDLHANPIQQFQIWLDEAIASEVIEPTAMSLSTVSSNGRCSSRIVLLKGFDADGFVFFTNYQSRKGLEMANSPHAALLFFWPELQRQVRIEGEIDKIAAEASDKYFHSRPKGSQLGAMASPQSTEVPSRGFLDERLDQLTKEYENSALVPRPPHWGGLVLKPDYIEFWQGRSNRMHDRLVYTSLNDNKEWAIKRIAP